MTEGKLGQPTVLITINPEDQSYSVDFKYCNLEHVYSILKSMITEFENGSFFLENECHVEDEDGRKLNPDEAREVITNTGFATANDKKTSRSN